VLDTHRRSFDGEYTTTRAGPNQVLFFSPKREARFRGLGHAVGSRDTPLRVCRGALSARKRATQLRETGTGGLKRRREREGIARAPTVRLSGERRPTTRRAQRRLLSLLSLSALPERLRAAAAAAARGHRHAR
jgi:hypothetical protein